MSNWIEKWQGDMTALMTPERRRMREALARLEAVKAVEPKSESSQTRLVFLLDLTASRSASLRNARMATAAMFDTVKGLGSVAVKLIYYRGEDECKVGTWQSDPAVVSRAMQKLSCKSGCTQIARGLTAVLTEDRKPSGVVFIGDHCEDSEHELKEVAAELGAREIPLYVFHECDDGDTDAYRARTVFKRMAELSGGAYCEFNPDSAAALRELLTSVAAFSTAGAEGLQQAPAPVTPIGRELQQRLLLLPPRKPDLQGKS